MSAHEPLYDAVYVGEMPDSPFAVFPGDERIDAHFANRLAEKLRVRFPDYTIRAENGICILVCSDRDKVMEQLESMGMADADMHKVHDGIKFPNPAVAQLKLPSVEQQTSKPKAEGAGNPRSKTVQHFMNS